MRVTTAPRAEDRPMARAMSGVTGWTFTPSQPRRVSPYSMSWAITGRATALGTEKEIPTLAPVGEKIAVFTPMTSPSRLNSGPPELPRLMETSLCR
jgi:hypothetical protein